MNRPLVTGLLILLCNAGLCVVKGAGYDDIVANQFRQLERDIPSLYLINGLHLTQEQAVRLVGLLESAKKNEDRYNKKSQKVVRAREKDFLKELENIVSTASKGRDVRPEEDAGSLRGKRLMQARQKLNSFRYKQQRELDKLADKAYGALTESQRTIVNNFVPCFIPARDFRNPERVGQAVSDTSFVEAALVRLRKIPDEQRMDEALERALDRLVPYAMEKRHIKYSEEAEEDVRDELSVRLESAVARICQMSDADFELDKKNIAAKVLPLETGGKGDDPGALRWKMQRYVLNTGILDVMRARAGGSGELTAPAFTKAFSDPKDPSDKSASQEGSCISAADMGRDLRTAAILSGLDLTREQAGNLLTIVRGALEAKEKIENEVAQTMEEGLEKYGKLRGELASGQPTDRVESEANHYHSMVKRLYDEKLLEELLNCEAELDQLLTAGQVAYLSGDTQTMVRKRMGSDRQIDKTMNRAMRVVSESRRMSAVSFAEKKDKLCREFVNECLRKYGLKPGDIDVEAEVKRASAVLERARKMSNTDYVANRDELATELCPKRCKPRPATYGTKYVHGTPVPMLSFSSRLLFSDTARDILERMARD